jgi:hypothetical protein
MPNPLDCHPKRIPAALNFQYTPHDISFGRPKMQQAPIAFARNGVFRLSEIEELAVVFNYYCAAAAVQKLPQRRNQALSVHVQKFSRDAGRLSVTDEHSHKEKASDAGLRESRFEDSGR